MIQERFAFLLGVILSLGIILLVPVNGGDAMKGKMKCLDQEVDLKDYMKGFIECATAIMPEEDVKTFKDPNTSAEKKKEIGMKAHSNMCIRVCQWKNHTHIINEDGSYNKAEQDGFIDKVFPEAAREGLKSGIAKCYDDNSKAFNNDNNCESYKPFEACLIKSYVEVCKIDAKQVQMDNM